MPRMLPINLIKVIAINYLLELYEQEKRFIQEWETARQPFTHIIEQMGLINSLSDVDDMLAKNPPHDLITMFRERQNLINYLCNVPNNPIDINDSSQSRTEYHRLQKYLAPYFLKLGNLAGIWNLRAPWAAEELLQRDLLRAEQNIFNAAGVEMFDNLSSRQIQNMFGPEGRTLSSYNYPINCLALYRAGGRLGLVNEFSKDLVEFEKQLKASNSREIPSSLKKHAEWWFDYYIHGIDFHDISFNIVTNNEKRTTSPENIRLAVVKYSKLININPEERN